MKKFLIAAPLALAASALLTSPASAAPWDNAGQIRSELNQLDRQIDRLRGLSPREEQRLENRLDQLQDQYRSFARGGFTRAELQRLSSGVSQLKASVYAQSNDRNNRPGPNGRYDGHRDHR
jgi:TolA-binding protein